MDIVILKQAEKELKNAPKDLIQDIYSLFDELSQGKLLGMPISKSLSSIVRGLHELRLSGKTGEFRVFYYIKIGDAIYIIHASSKKKQFIDKKTIDLIKNRTRSIE